jgi:hypothetical protein
MSYSFWQQSIGGLFALALVSALVGLLFSWGNATALTTVVAVLAGALVLVAVLDRVIDFAVGPVKATLGRIEQGQQILESDIRAIRVALKGVVTKYEHEYLRRLADPQRFPSEVGDFEYHYEDDKHHYTPDVYPRLKRLDDIGYIRPTEIDGHRLLLRIVDDHARDESLPNEERPRFKLREYAEITEAGRNYLALAGLKYL